MRPTQAAKAEAHAGDHQEIIDRQPILADQSFVEQVAAAIGGIVIGERERMYRLCHELRGRGLWVAPVDYPAVPEDRICFRACVTANHTRADLDEALNIISDIFVPAVREHARAS